MVLESNPYEGNERLTRLEADVLWEYAKLAENVKKLVSLTKDASDVSSQQFADNMRLLERKLGLVMTLFKGSLWAVMNDRWEADETVSDEDNTFSEGDITVMR